MKKLMVLLPFLLLPALVSATIPWNQVDPCAADINHDGIVDSLDAAILQAHYGTQIGNPNYLAAADFNQDGFINIFDAAFLSVHYGTICDPPDVVFIPQFVYITGMVVINGPMAL